MRIKVLLLLLFVCFLGVNQPQSAELFQKVEFFQNDLVFSTNTGFDQIYLKGCDMTDKVGEPQLPVKQVQVVLPAGTEVAEVIVTSAHGEYLPGQYQIFPVQPPRILSLMDQPIPFVQPQVKVYEKSVEYPGKLAEYTGTGFLGGYQLANILVYPVQYVPAERKIKFYSHMVLKISYSEGMKKPLAVSLRSQAGAQVYQTMVKKAAFNAGGASLGLVPQRIMKYTLPPGDYEYVIITDENFVSTFQPLADWKTQKGVPAKIVTTQWIYSNFTGYDNAEKVRNFIKDAYQNWGTIWVLLGGDTNVVPDRAAWAMDCEFGMEPDENLIRCDLYFSDLDGSWDANGNHFYGEVEDSVDLYADVFVGRASCSDVGKAQALVGKLLNYEKNPPTDYTTKMLFLADILWNDPYTNSALSKELIDEEYVPSQFDPITKLYHDLGNESPTTVKAAINDGQNIINHDGHCWYTVMGAGTGYLGISDMDALYNNPRNSILYSIGCWPAAFDYDCIAEHFINNPNGGGVAFIGNSRYGWGSPGNPLYGYSDKFDQQFFASLFSKDIYHIGAAVADMKSYYVPFSRQENVYRWHQYQVNLLGDPEMPIWTDTPQILASQHPDTVLTGSSQFPVTVYNTAGMEPVPEALVCLMKGDQVYQRCLTDQQGQVTLDVSPSTPGEIYLTITAHNFLYRTDTIDVVTSGGCVLYHEHSIDDATVGNGDGLVNPGETINMTVTLKNWGSEVEYNVYAILHSTGDPYVTLTDSLQDFGIMNPGETAASFGPYVFSIDSNCPNQHVIYFDLEMNEGYDLTWHSMIPITVVTPDLIYYNYWVYDAVGGNGNGKPEPGETFDLNVSIKNKGMEQASDVTGYLSSFSSYLHIPDSSASFGDIPSEQIWSGVFEDVYLYPSCPSYHFPYMNLRAETSQGFSCQDSFILNIGEGGFEDDMESGDGLWTHGGTLDYWHLTGNRVHSGLYSWYNGLEGLWYFEDNMLNWLQTSSFVIEPESYLSFWMWYDVTNYGVDGVHVQIVDALSGIPDTIDFIGTGGALDSALNTGNDWLEYRYDLSFIPPGTTIRVRFSFTSDDEYSFDGEGFYIDDVKVGTKASTWLPGDVTGDGLVDASDVIYLLNYLFKGGPAPVPFERGDVTNDGEVSASDIVYLLSYLYRGGPPPG
jgi:hypothetical protein